MICYRGGGNFATGIFRCGKFRISNVCEISRSMFRPLCEINPARNFLQRKIPGAKIPPPLYFFVRAFLSPAPPSMSLSFPLRPPPQCPCPFPCGPQSIDSALSSGD